MQRVCLPCPSVNWHLPAGNISPFGGIECCRNELRPGNNLAIFHFHFPSQRFVDKMSDSQSVCHTRNNRILLEFSTIQVAKWHRRGCRGHQMSSPEKRRLIHPLTKRASIVTLCWTRRVFICSKPTENGGNQADVYFVPAALCCTEQDQQTSKLTTKRHLIKTDALPEHVDVKL